MSRRRTRGLIGLAAGLAVTTATFGLAVASTQGDGAYPLNDGKTSAQQHGEDSGHLPGSKTNNIELISKLQLKNVVPEKIADVGIHKDHAYLAAWGVQTCKYNGVHVVDISDVNNPREVAFIRSQTGSYPGEGIHTMSMSTSSFTGDILVSNNETCNDTTGFGGLNLYDITNPKAPTPLAEGIGDFTANGQGKKDANRIHSVFAWQAGDRAYVVMTDNDEGTDVDIMDITDPKKPFLTAEYDLDEYVLEASKGKVDITQATPTNLQEVFLHDMVVKEINGKQVMLLSYWDGGYVTMDVTNVHKPVYMGDTDFATSDPEMKSGRTSVPPEGNAHQAEFTRDNKYFVAADEDFAPYALTGRNTTDGTEILAGQGSDTKQLVGETIAGGTKFAGLACNTSPAVPPANGSAIAVVERGGCTFTEKVANVEKATGYEAILIFNREGSDACDIPLGMSVEGGIPTFGVAPRSQGFAIFNKSFDKAACEAGDGSQQSGIEIGATGDSLEFKSYFDGWGYVHLFENKAGKMTALDTYAVPEAHDPAYANGYGDLSVHEVATSHAKDNLLYFAYYSAGFRVAEIQRNRIVETGHYIDEGGSNFWGVEVFNQGGTEYVATSDRDYGLWIFKYNGGK